MGTLTVAAERFFGFLGPFVFVLGVIIFVHEFGHFLTAKLFGMRVFIFSFGFGRRLLGFRWGDTDCRVSLVPLGGYVKLEGELDDPLSGGSSLRGDSRDFASRPRWQRFVVYVAGPFMNGVLTMGVLTAFHMVGFGVDATLYDPPIVGAVEPGSPAEAAGILPGDELVSIDGKNVPKWEDALYTIWLRPNATFNVRLRREGRENEVEARSTSTGAEKAGKLGVAPLVRIGSVKKGSPAEEAGLQADDGILEIAAQHIGSFAEIPPLVGRSAGKRLGFTVYRSGRILKVEVTPRDSGSGPQVGIFSKTVIRKFGFLRSVKESGIWTWSQTKLTGETVRGLLTGAISLKSMMGPLGIAKASGERAREGPGSLFFLIAVISLQVGLLNLFPLAPLDGGHMAILASEGLLRRDFSMGVKAWIMNAGATVLFLLVGLVLYSDLSKTSVGRFLP